MSEQALRESEERYRRLVEASSDGIVMSDLEGNILEANPQYLDMFGYESLEELRRQGGSGIDSVIEQDRPRFIELMQETMLEGAMRNVEFTSRRKDGTCFPTESSGVLLLNSSGEPQGFIGLVRDISERKQAEKALRQSHRLISGLLNAPLDIALVLDPEGIIVYANETIAKIAGLQPSELIGKRHWDLFPERSSFRSEVLCRVLQSGKPERVEDEAPTGLYDSTIYPILDDHGKATHVAVFARDITDRVRAEQALRESEERYRRLVEASPDGIMMTDPEGRILTANQQLLEMYGYNSLEELTSKIPDAFMLVAEQDRPHVIDNLRKLATDSRRKFEYHTHRKDGSLFPVESSGVLLRDASGLPYALMGVVRDISERKRAEQALRESEERYRKLVEASPDGIVLTNLQGRIIDANKRYLEMRAFDSLEDLLSKAPNGFSNLTEDDQRRLREYMQQVIQQGALHSIEFLATRKDGSFFPSETSGALVRDASGQPSAFVGIVRDISERKHAHQALEQAHAELERRVTERTAELAAANLQLRNHAARAEALARVAERVNARLDLQTVLETVCEEAALTLGLPIASVQLYDEHSDTLPIVASFGPKPSRVEQTTPLPRTVYEQFISTQGPVAVLPDLQQIPNPYNSNLVTELQVRTVISAPMIHNNEFIGCLNLSSTGEIHNPSPEELELVKALANQATVAIANARLFEQVLEERENSRALSQKLVEIQEAERRHLSRELHDEIGQTLTYLTLLLDMATKPPTSPEAIPVPKTELLRARELVDEILEHIRDLSHRLRPGILDDLGLLPALQNHFECFTQQTGIRVSFKHGSCDRRFPPQVETTAFRMIQEALTNVARHATIDEVRVRLWCDQRVLGLQIEDHGGGFDVRDVFTSQRTTGLPGMQERIDLCNGQLEIESSPGGGTCLTAEIPIVYE